MRVEVDGHDDLQALLVDEAAAANASPEQWADVEWRLCNLYWIVDKTASTVRFEPNPQQLMLIRNVWHRTLVLKARQLGFSTLIAILQLDQALFTQNFNGVIIADTLPNAAKLFGKATFAYEHLPPVIQQAFPIVKKNEGSMLVIGHADEGGLSCNSTVSVGVSARGGTVNLLHVSELGKIALKFPQRAAEIQTGAIPAVVPDGHIVIESTAEGAFGLFWDLCEPAIKRMRDGTAETVKDWRLLFFPWYEQPEYRLSDEDTALVTPSREQTAYFNGLQAKLGITLDANQRAWYVKEAETQKKKMKQEYPSTPEEAFEQATEGAVYGEEMTRLREQGRLVDAIGVDPGYPVHTFWDFGTRHVTAVWFMQYIGLQFRWFYYVERSGKGLGWWWRDVLEPHRNRYGYTWGTHFLPHDADMQMLGMEVETKRQILESAGMGRPGGGSIKVVPRIPTIGQGIELTKQWMTGNHYFDKRKPDVDQGEDLGAGWGIRTLDGYQYEWNEKQGVWSTNPLDNWAADGADAFRQGAQGWEAGASFGSDPTGFSAFKRRKRLGL